MPESSQPRFSRRALLAGIGGGVGLGVAAGAASAVGAERAGMLPGASPADDANGRRTHPFHGRHQSGIARAPAAFATFLAFTLEPGTDREGLRRLMRLWSDDAARLTAGEGALADVEPENAAFPAGLTVTFGWGPEAARLAVGAEEVPEWLAPLPPFSIDRLEDRWSGGDLLVLLASDEPVALSHAARMIVRDASGYARLLWRQQGFRHAHGSRLPGATMRNLFGQVDGTVNAVPDSAEFDDLVWIRDGWLAGGTSFVLRRIAMNLDTWDEVDRVGREFAVGRRLDTGAPLTGTHEHDEPDFDATTPAGLPVISDVAHIRRARPSAGERGIVRLGYNYDDIPANGERHDTGLLFGSWQANVATQFTPMQARLAEADLMNTWTTPVGSAVFAIPPGCAEGGYIGDSVLE